jgi:hypothetical protein
MSESAISPSQDLRIWLQISRDPMIWLNTHPLSPLSRRQARPATHKKTEKERQPRERVDEEPNHTTARNPGHLLNIQYCTLSKAFMNLLVNQVCFKSSLP